MRTQRIWRYSFLHRANEIMTHYDKSDSNGISKPKYLRVLSEILTKRVTGCLIIYIYIYIYIKCLIHSEVKYCIFPKFFSKY